MFFFIFLFFYFIFLEANKSGIEVVIQDKQGLVIASLGAATSPGL